MANTSIEPNILKALNTIFTNELIAAFPTSDPLRLRRLIAAPLQDDPTQAAPYLVYGPAYEVGSGPSDEEMAQIGGDMLWMTPWRAVAGTPRARDRDTAYTYINELARRVEHVVLKHFDLSNVLGPGQLTSDDGTERIDAINPLKMWQSTRTRIYGGDGEFYGEALMYWCYNFFRAPGFTF